MHGSHHSRSSIDATLPPTPPHGLSDRSPTFCARPRHPARQQTLRTGWQYARDGTLVGGTSVVWFVWNIGFIVLLTDGGGLQEATNPLSIGFCASHVGRARLFALRPTIRISGNGKDVAPTFTRLLVYFWARWGFATPSPTFCAKPRHPARLQTFRTGWQYARDGTLVGATSVVWIVGAISKKLYFTDQGLTSKHYGYWLGIYFIISLEGKAIVTNEGG